MRVFEKQDFESMDFNPYGVRMDLQKKYTKIQIVPGLKRALDGPRAQELTKYILYMYDMKSPLKDYFPNISVRKTQAADLAGFNLETEENYLDNLYNLTGQYAEHFVHCISEYLISQNNRLWSMIVSNEQTFYEYQQRLREPVEAEKDKELLQALQIKSKLMEDCNNINERLDGYYRKLFGEDENVSRSVVKRKRLTPEQIAAHD